MRILILDGHPDPAPERLCHALADAYAAGAEDGGHEVRRIDVAGVQFPMLRDAVVYRQGRTPPAIEEAQASFLWAEHLVLVYPLWLGTQPALLKGFFEQTFRPGFAFQPTDGKGWPEPALTGRSARVVVTMGMPALAYRWLYGAHSLKSLERNVLKFVGFSPIRETLFGSAETADAETRAGWLDEMRALGRDAK